MDFKFIFWGEKDLYNRIDKEYNIDTFNLKNLISANRPIAECVAIVILPACGRAPGKDSYSIAGDRCIT